MLRALAISLTSGTLNVSLTRSLLPSGEYASRSNSLSLAHYHRIHLAIARAHTMHR